MTITTQSDIKNALAEFGKLKRVLGIPNHPQNKDAIIDGTLHIYTSDKESAALIGEILYRFGSGNKAAFYDARPEMPSIRDSIKLGSLIEGGYEVEMYIPYAPKLTKALQKVVAKHIEPDKNR